MSDFLSCVGVIYCNQPHERRSDVGRPKHAPQIPQHDNIKKLLTSPDVCTPICILNSETLNNSVNEKKVKKEVRHYYSETYDPSSEKNNVAGFGFWLKNVESLRSLWSLRSIWSPWSLWSLWRFYKLHRVLVMPKIRIKDF